jgi:hypothetical protein
MVLHIGKGQKRPECGLKYVIYSPSLTGGLKSGAEAPHFLSLNHDIVAWSQEAESYLAILLFDLKV